MKSPISLCALLLWLITAHWGISQEEELPPARLVIEQGRLNSIEIEGKQHAFVGDLILAGGHVRNLYSFQDEIRAAKIGGYHGYLGRLGRWIESLQRVAATNPDIIVSSRGHISENPNKDIETALL